MTTATKGHVYLVGAGPGDPELLTIKALRLLETADTILYDDLVPQELLSLASKTALTISVGKRCGLKKITQAQIHSMMIESARKGLSVVRLKSGDPLIFGRAAEEMDALNGAGIPFEVVPGGDLGARRRCRAAHLAYRSPGRVGSAILDRAPCGRRRGENRLPSRFV